MVNAVQCDRDCSQNIEWIGENFRASAADYTPDASDAEDQLLHLLVLTYRFVCELDLKMPDDLSMELRFVRSFVQDNLSTVPEKERAHFIYAAYMMPASILKKMLGSPDIATMREITERERRYDELKAQWEAEMATREGRVARLQEALKKLEAGFNFVGLVDGFRKLAKEKQTEKRVAFWSLIALAVLVVAPLGIELALLWRHSDSLDSFRMVLIFSIPALVAIEVAAIYFFRVVLLHFRSIKAQLLQLDLRASLCQFIESYAEYSKDVKGKDATALAKFENIVFSGLQASEDKLPSTFDGLDQIAAIVKTLKG